MKRIVRLTESDLTRIVRRVVKESRLLNEAYPYDVLKSNPTPAVIAKALYDAYGGMGNDCEACVVAALQAIKPGQANINAVSDQLKKLNGGVALNQWIASFNEGGDLTNLVHNGTSIGEQIARIYQRGFDPKISPFNLYKWDASAKDDLKNTMSRFHVSDRGGGGGMNKPKDTMFGVY